MTSAITNLPSASVWIISTVFPLYAVIISEGLYDSHEIWFSANPIAATIFTCNFLLSSCFIVAKTHPAHPISPFISYIISPGFTWIPPVSNVTHFHTNQIVGRFLSIILSIITKYGLWTLHFHTACKRPSHFFSICFGDRILTFVFLNFASLTFFANDSG
jgi:hypothetical protein